MGHDTIWGHRLRLLRVDKDDYSTLLLPLLHCSSFGDCVSIIRITSTAAPLHLSYTMVWDETRRRRRHWTRRDNDNGHTQRETRNRTRDNTAAAGPGTGHDADDKDDTMTDTHNASFCIDLSLCFLIFLSPRLQIIPVLHTDMYWVLNPSSSSSFRLFIGLPCNRDLGVTINLVTKGL